VAHVPVVLRSAPLFGNVLVSHRVRSRRLRVALGVGESIASRLRLRGHRIVAQPFSLRAEVDGQMRRHIPDYLWGSDDGPVVVDVVRAERMTQPKIVLLCAWTKAVVESLGWSYLVVNEPSEIRLGNVRFLSGYRRGWLINPDVLAEMLSSSGQFDGMSIADAEQAIGTHPRPLVRPALMHLLWIHEYRVDLDQPLRPSTVLEVSR
jgi:hypothetical protein